MEHLRLRSERMEVNTIIQGDCLEVLKTLPDNSIDCCVTSPPYYGLRDYGTGEWVGGDPDCDHIANPNATKKMGNDEFNVNRPSREETITKGFYKKICPKCGAIREDKQIGLEESPKQYIDRLVAVFHEVKRVLKDDGTLWLNIGDSYCNSNGYARADEQFQREGRNNAPANDRDLSSLHEAGFKTKDLMGIPWMLAFALRNDGWYLRQDIIWHKPNPMPESVKDRCTKAHEYIFLMSKKPQYYFDYEAIQEEAIWKDDKRATQGRTAYEGKGTEGTDSHAQQSFVSFSRKKKTNDKTVGIRFGGNKYGDNEDSHYQTYSGKEWTPQMKNTDDGDEEIVVRNKRDVWSVTLKPCKEAHFATFPEDLIKPCILAGCRIGGVVLDPFFGSGTTGRVAESLNRNYLGIELNPEYIEIGKRRTNNVQLSLEGFLTGDK